MGKLNPSKWVRRSLSLLCTMTLGLSLMGSPLVVYADDYTYIPVSDLELYNAYRYWNIYGYFLDYQQSVSYNLEVDGTYSWSGTLNSTSLGSEAGSINVTVTGTSTSLDGQGGSLSSFNTLFSLNGLIIDIDPVLNSGNVTGTQYACTVNPQTENWTCTNNYVYQMPTFDATIRDLTGAEAVSMSQLYLTLASREDGGGTYAGQITLNQSGTHAGTGSIDLEGDISATNHKIYDIPILSLNVINNNTNFLKQFYLNNNNDFILAILQENYGYLNDFSILSNSHNDITSNFTINRTKYQNVGGYILQVIQIHRNNVGSDIVYLAFNTLPAKIIPLYVGYINNMSNEMYRYIYGADREYNLIESGNSSSQSVQNNSDSTNNSFNTAASQYETIENGFNNNMNTALNNISTTSQMLNNNKFLASANWVRVQFERIVLNTPFELLIIYCLILGLALVLIGKVR